MLSGSRPHVAVVVVAVHVYEDDYVVGFFCFVIDFISLKKFEIKICMD